MSTPPYVSTVACDEPLEVVGARDVAGDREASDPLRLPFEEFLRAART